MKPLANKQPNTIILHIGTNHLNRKINTFDNLSCVISEIKSRSKDTQVVVSGLTTRHDKPEMDTNVRSLNEELKVFCKNNCIDYINNDNIDLQCLSRKKLHLNQKGTSRLAKNFKAFIDTN